MSIENSSFNRRQFLSTAYPLLLSAAAGSGFVRAQGEQKLQIGIIGCGVRGFQLIQRMIAMEDVDLIAFGDLWDDHFNRIRELGYGRRFFTPMYGKVLRAGIDAVVIAAPDHLHTEFLLEARRLGKPAYVEPPFSWNWSDWAGRIEDGASPDVQSFPGCQQFSSPSALTARAWLAEGKIGELQEIQGDCSGFLGGWSTIPARSDLEERKWNWFLGGELLRPYEPEQFFQWSEFSYYSRGPALRHLVHLLTAIQTAVDLGEVLEASAVRSHATEERTEDHVSTLLKFSRVPLVSLAGRENRHPLRHLIRLFGEEGEIQFSRDECRLYRRPPLYRSVSTWSRRRRERFLEEEGVPAEQIELEPLPPDEPAEAVRTDTDPTEIHLRRFFDGVRNGRFDLALESQRKIEKAGHLIRQSLASGGPAAVEALPQA